MTLEKPSLEVAPTILRLVCYLFTVFTSDLLFLHVARCGFSQFHSNLQPKKQHLSFCDPKHWPVTLTYKLDLVKVNHHTRDGTRSGFLTRDPLAFDPVSGDPTPADLVVKRCETNSQQRLDSSISYLSGNPSRLVA